MSVYGCPDQSVNKWAQGYIDIKNTMDYDGVLMEKTLGPVTPEKNLFTIGPFQSDGFRLSFCSKQNIQYGTREPNSDTEWPRGNYAIFLQNKTDVTCPKGQEKILTRHLPFLLY